MEFNIVIDSVTDSSNFNKWYIEASEEDKQVLYKWIADKRCKTHEDKLKRFVLHLPLFQFADEYKSYEEIDSLIISSLQSISFLLKKYYQNLDSNARII